MSKILVKIVFISVLLLACNKDKANLKITNFSKSQTVVLNPYKFYPYSMLNIKVKGYCNDTIKIKMSKGSHGFLFSGEIDTILKTDYYGEGKRTFTFVPYKATEGELEINIKL